MNLLSILILFVTAFVCVFFATINILFKKCNETTLATVFKVELRDYYDIYDGTRNVWVCTYTFKDKRGRMHNGDVHFFDMSDCLKVGDEVPIRYVEAFPHFSKIDKTFNTEKWFYSLIFCCTLFVLFGLLVFFTLI